MRVRAVGEKGIRTRCLVYPWSLTDYLPIFSLRALCLSAKDKTTTRTTRDNKKVVFGCLSCLLYKEQGRGGTRFVASVPMRRVGTRALPHDRRHPTSDTRSRRGATLPPFPPRETKDGRDEARPSRNEKNSRVERVRALHALRPQPHRITAQGSSVREMDRTSASAHLRKACSSTCPCSPASFRPMRQA